MFAEMLGLLIFGIVVLGSVSGAAKQNGGIPDLRIINGTDAETGEFPYVVSLQKDLSHICGASILTTKWCLTAAHCVQGLNVSTLTVLAGTLSLDGNGQRREVERVIAHDDFNPNPWWKNDVGLVKVKTPFVLNYYVGVIDLPKPFAEVEPGTPVTVAGWGVLETNGALSETLKKAELLTTSDEECRKTLFININESQICAGVPEGYKGECQGDSGSALQTKGQVVGIVSWSFKPCAKPPFVYGVYTQVSYFVDWIELTIWVDP